VKKYTYSILITLLIVAFYFIEKKLDTDYYDDYKKEVTIKGSTSSFNYLPSSTTDAIVKHAYYTLSYVEKHEQAEWVAYHLKKEHTAYNNFKRPYFEIDPLVKSNAASWRNYKNSGYDRGHLCPAADRKFNKKAFEETFLTSNISPQLNSFNAGIWNNLEKQVRYWVKKEKELFIVTGSSKSLSKFVISVDELEELSNIDFFKALPDELENKLEATNSSNGWKFINFN